MKRLAFLLAAVLMTGCKGLGPLSVNVIQMHDKPGPDAEYDTEDDTPGDRLELAKFDNLWGPSVAVLYINGEYKAKFAEAGLIPATSTGAGIAMSGVMHDYVGDNINVNQTGGGASANSSSTAQAKAAAQASAKASAKQYQTQRQGQVQGQQQGQQQGIKNKNKGGGHGGD